MILSMYDFNVTICWYHLQIVPDMNAGNAIVNALSWNSKHVGTLGLPKR